MTQKKLLMSQKMVISVRTRCPVLDQALRKLTSLAPHLWFGSWRA